jgi:hypothetical protein
MPTRSLAERVAGVSWYHTLQLGEIETPGNFDTPGELARVPFPKSLAGKRCLDVATADELSVDAISPRLTLLYPVRPVACLEAPGWPLWWVPNLRGYRALFPAAKLRILDSGRPFFVKRRPAYIGAYVATAKRRNSPSARVKHAALARLGNLHSWVHAVAV